MSVSIRPCPQCHSMLIGDSANCPHCGHILDTARASEFVELIESSELDTSENEGEEDCPQCGERVRVGLVRCWSCGAFMKSELEASYREMQASPPPITYSGSAETATPEEEDFQLGATMMPPVNAQDAPREEPVAETSDDEDDFQLAPNVDAIEGEEDDFELTTPIAARADDGDDFELSPSVAEASQTGDSDEIPSLGEDEAADEDSYSLQSAEPVEEDTVEDAVEEVIDEVVEEESVADEVTDDVDAEESERPAADYPDTPHSVSTGGDVLLKAALQEEKESTKRGKKPKVGGDRFLVFCPNGHKIQVSSRHRGRAGRCPQCKSLFFVPELTEKPDTPKAEEAPALTVPNKEPFSPWIEDIRLHVVNPTKLKLKAGSLANEFETVDLGFSETELLIATVFKGVGTFAKMQEAKKKPAKRTELREYLARTEPLESLPVTRQLLISDVEAPQLKIVQPADPSEESLFAGIPVFGEGRIAVRVPSAEASERLYLSFGLTEFRKLAVELERVFGIVNFGLELGIPLEDQFQELTCHYSEVTFQALENVDYYRADPAFKVITVGRKCQGCGLVVSEDARKKEKIGNASGSNVAKAKCPKCKTKFGDTTFFAFEPAAASADQS